MEFNDYEEDVIDFPVLFEFRQKKHPTYKSLKTFHLDMN